MGTRIERLRCFVHRVGQEWQGYCVDADVRVAAMTARAARARLNRRLEQLVAQFESSAPLVPAPFAVRVRYHLLRLTTRGRQRTEAAYEYVAPPEWLPGLA